ncbi:hypothetical protein AGLY_000215 [Aphis glycines]|uniref:Uncharacterized protein n=1 Tax=Aphis glycines TaxID=307491 RepID=A0A6G0U6V5_APHGL|nr:hypothetical protein AGLY_000215 [Aphis glycines]
MTSSYLSNIIKQLINFNWPNTVILYSFWLLYPWLILGTSNLYSKGGTSELSTKSLRLLSSIFFTLVDELCREKCRKLNLFDRCRLRIVISNCLEPINRFALDSSTLTSSSSANCNIFFRIVTLTNTFQITFLNMLMYLNLDSHDMIKTRLNVILFINVIVKSQSAITNLQNKFGLQRRKVGIRKRTLYRKSGASMMPPRNIMNADYVGLSSDEQNCLRLADPVLVLLQDLHLQSTTHLVWEIIGLTIKWFCNRLKLQKRNEIILNCRIMTQMLLMCEHTQKHIVIITSVSDRVIRLALIFSFITTTYILFENKKFLLLPLVGHFLINVIHKSKWVCIIVNSYKELFNKFDIKQINVNTKRLSMLGYYVIPVYH